MKAAAIVNSLLEDDPDDPELNLDRHVAEIHKTAMNIESIPWTSLNCYTFEAFPDMLVVTTNADKEVFNAAVAEFRESGGAENVEEILQGRGYAAVCGRLAD